MRLTLRAKLISREGRAANIGVEIHHNVEEKKLIPLFYIAMLRAMRNSHKEEFMEAMTQFIDEEIAALEGEDE